MRININEKIKIFYVLILFFQIQADRLSYELIDNTNFLVDKKIILNSENIDVGSISFCKFPLFKWYVLYDFYIEPKFRSKGYGKILLQYSKDKLITLGAKKIFIQPGPYEMDYAISKEQKNLKIKKLITFYQFYGFVFVNNFLSKMAKVLYYFASIDEDPKYLMVYKK